MAPSRTQQDSGTPVAGPSKERPHKGSRNHPYSNKPRRPTDEDALPGAQKLKSAIRQTKRLLAKDNVAADVRVETERRLKALEADLARAELSRKERHYATKYHKVKFFERQKIMRKINQTKRSISSSRGKEKKNLESVLGGLRVDLNYILVIRHEESLVSLTDNHLSISPKPRNMFHCSPLKSVSPGSTAAPVAASSDDNEERARAREAICLQMKSGELSNEPENELGKLGQQDQQLASSQRRTADVASSSIRVARSATGDVAGDDLFGDDEEAGEQSETSCS
ncbi:hypothetical protein JVU11DRAFT_7544 [Chiua virens]|nr:hypothetical protein JVU11DRAFT_7544 [Chiua virens]